MAVPRPVTPIAILPRNGVNEPSKPEKKPFSSSFPSPPVTNVGAPTLGIFASLLSSSARLSALISLAERSLSSCNISLELARRSTTPPSVTNIAVDSSTPTFSPLTDTSGAEATGEADITDFGGVTEGPSPPPPPPISFLSFSFLALFSSSWRWVPSNCAFTASS